MPLILLFLLVASAFAQPPDTLWVRNYPGSEANDIVMDEDGNLYLAGVYHPPYCTDDMYALKIGADYELEWLTSLEDDWTAGASTICLANNSVFLSGRGGSHDDGAGMVARLSLDGDSLWVNRFGGLRATLGDVVPDQANGVYVVGVTYEFAENGSSDGMLFHVDSTGEEQWCEYYGGEAGRNCLYNICRTPDNGFALAGYSSAFGGADQVYIVKTDSTGAEEWSGAYGDSLYSDIAQVIDILPNGDFILAGYTNRGSVDMLVIRVSADGEEIWRRNYGTDRWGEELCDLLVLPDGDIIVLGETRDPSGDGVLIRLDGNGEILWERSPIELGGLVACNSIIRAENNGYYFTGRRVVNGGHYSYVACTEPDPLYNGVELLNPAFPNSFAVQAPYPNPFNSTVTIGYSLPTAGIVSLAVYDLAGREVARLVDGTQYAGTHEAVWSADGMASGVYVVKLDANEMTAASKVLLVR